MSELLNSYELTYILGEQIKPEEAKTKATELTKMIEEMGGKVTREELWGRRELAYIIKHNRSGFYTTFWFDFPATQLKNLDQQLRFDEAIIRSLVTKAFNFSQPGSLYPVQEEEKTSSNKEDKASAEEMLRMSNTSSKKVAKEKEPVKVDELPDDVRLKKLDEKLDELLSEDQD